MFGCSDVRVAPRVGRRRRAGHADRRRASRRVRGPCRGWMPACGSQPLLYRQNLGLRGAAGEVQLVGQLARAFGGEARLVEGGDQVLRLVLRLIVEVPEAGGAHVKGLVQAACSWLSNTLSAAATGRWLMDW
mgnify:CR=1 FL=1